MYIESQIAKTINNIFTSIREKTSVLTEKSYILSNIDNIMFAFICISLIVSIFAGNAHTALFLFIVGFLYILTLVFKQTKPFQFSKTTLFLCLYFLIAVTSTINSTMVHASIIGLSKTVTYLVFFLAVICYLREHKEKIPFLAALVGLCVSFEVVIAFLQNNLHVMSAATWQDTTGLNPEDVLTRVYGTLKPSNPNLLGGYFIAATPFLWMHTSLSFIDRKYTAFVISFCFSIASIPAIFMTGCRGAYIALFIMFLFLAVFFYKICKTHFPNLYKTINKYKSSIITCVFAFVSIVMICVPKISHRIFSIFAMRNDSSTSFRMNVYNSALQMFHDNFLFGIGCGNKVFREIYGLYMLSGFDALSAYSVFLETAVENGIFGVMFFILFLWFLLFDGIKSFVTVGNIKTKIILAACIISIIGIMVHGFVDTVYFRPQIQLIFWSAVAIIISNFEFKNNTL